MESYKTIKRKAEAEFKDRGSKFIGLAFEVKSREEVDEYLKEVKKQYYDARHHCYGFVLGDKGETTFSSDDGEPSHSAGDPILGQIKSQELTYALVVVVRYFGGTKLGVPGLIHAYKTAAAVALEKADTKDVELKFHFSIQFEYENTAAVEQLASTQNLEYLEKNYTENCHLVFAAGLGKKEVIAQQLSVMKAKNEVTEYQIED